ncbi:hypothetical protein SAMN04489724_0700 [Algoriphagus locisalis]|uniref:4-amino-4-deoxy-L-arabinose transferase n=2 Tax=Algoriphagus locisalis TaxID=305507 RepID=A0A1I6XW34_9BACT|nr:hypothetical protein SAMN04489724_0700 [Algoriphagus locisalis]
MLLPYLIFGEDVYLPVTDNMDSNLAWYKMLKDQGKVFSSWNTPVQGMLLELPRFSYPSGFNIELLLFALFPFFKAYIINKALICIIAFFSFRFWLRGQKLIFGDNTLEVLICLLWASLAFYPHRGISIAALPAVVQVFVLLLRKKETTASLMILIGYAIYSMLSLAALYLLLGILFWLLVVCFLERKFHLKAILFWCFLLIFFLVQEIHLIKGYFFNPSFISHRTEFTYDFGIWTQQYPWVFFGSGDQNGVHYSPIYIIFMLCLGIYAWYKKSASRKGFLFLALLLLISCLLSLVSLTGSITIMGKLIPELGSLNVLRFEYWIPFLMMASIVYFWAKLHFLGYRVLIPLFLCVNIFLYQYEWRYTINSYIHVLDQKVPTYSSYFAETQFEELKVFLADEQGQERFINFNIPPAVATFNGLQTYDGYLQVYAKSHKEKVYQVIQHELEKDQSLKAHFLDWGNKCYFQNAQYPDDYFMYKWRNESPLMEPDYDYDYLKEELEVDYILSALPVESDKMSLVKVFENESSAWRIHLYELK